MDGKHKIEYDLWSSLGISLLIMLGLYGLMMLSDLLPDSIRYNKSAYMLIYCIIGILFILSIFFILKYRKLKNAYEQDHQIELNDIAEVICREGYTPQKEDDDLTIIFKISGEPFIVRYEKDCLSIRRHYNLADDIDLEKLRKAAIMTEEELFLSKIYIPTYEDGTSSIMFEVPLLISSAKEIYRQFSICLHILLNSINKHRELYSELMTPQEDAGDVSQVALEHKNKFVS